MSPELSRETRVKLCALSMMLSSYQVRGVLGWGGHPAHHSQLSFLRTGRVTGLGAWGPLGVRKEDDVSSEGGQMGSSKGGMTGMRDNWSPMGPQHSVSLEDVSHLG